VPHEGGQMIGLFQIEVRHAQQQLDLPGQIVEVRVLLGEGVDPSARLRECANVGLRDKRQRLSGPLRAVSP